MQAQAFAATNFMRLKQFTDSWWFWGICVSATLLHGYLYHWEWITWFILGCLAVTAIVRIVARRRKRAEGCKTAAPG
jgi:hypothetical protein